MKNPVGYGLRWLRSIALALGSVWFASAAWAQMSIESISASVQGGTEVIRIDLSGPIASVPSGFTIQSPARIALDFPGVVNGMGRSTVEVNQGNLRSATVVQAGERTRVVLNLKQATTYKSEIKGRTLLVSLDGVAAAAAPVATSTAGNTLFAESRNNTALPLRDIDFRRGSDNSGRIVVDLRSNQVGVDIRQQGSALVVEFLKSTLPQGLRRRLDVTDFGTPVQMITTTEVGERVRMTIDARGSWTHSAYQNDNQLVVEVRELKVDPTKLTQGPNFTGEKLSLNFQSIDVRSLLQVIADFTNFNVVTSDTVTGSLTLRLKDVPWDQALQIILDAKGLGLQKNGSVLWIAPKEEIDARTKRDFEASRAIEDLEPVRTQAFQLNYARATDIAAQLVATGTGAGGAGGARFLSPRGTAIPEPRTNQLFVTDISSRLAQVQELLSRLDVAVRQVLIEARIVEASDTFGKSLGVRLGGTDQRALRGGEGGYGIGGGNRVAIGSSYNNLTGTTGANTSVSDAAMNTASNFVNLPTAGAGGFEAARFALSIFSPSANRFLNLEISALEADGKGKVVSSPRVVTADQTKALIEQGTELPYQVATASGATSIAFRKANLKLEVTPQITPEGNIILELDVNKDSVGQATAAGFAINTKHIKTQVLVENGGTVVIGGIFELQEQENEAKVPLLGDLPGVGNLFKRRDRTTNKQELLVFITPKVISDRAGLR